MKEEYKKIGFLLTFLGYSGGIPVIGNELLNCARNDDVVFSYNKINFRNSFILDKKSTINNINLINKTSKEKKLDLVHYQFHLFPMFLTNIKYTITIYDTYLIRWRMPHLAILTILNCMKAEKIIVSSESTKKDLTRILKRFCLGRLAKKINVIYLPIDKDFLKFADLFKTKTKNYFLIVGVGEEENLDFLIKGAREIAPRYNIKITGKINDKLKDKLIKKYGTLDFEGFVDKKRLAQLYKECFCIIYRNYNEGFGYIPLESLLVKKPIITNPDKSIKEVLDKYGVYYEDFETYKKQIRFLIKNRKKFEKNAELGRRYALQKFNSKIITENYFRVLGVK